MFKCSWCRKVREYTIFFTISAPSIYYIHYTIFFRKVLHSVLNWATCSKLWQLHKKKNKRLHESAQRSLTSGSSTWAIFLLFFPVKKRHFFCLLKLELFIGKMVATTSFGWQWNSTVVALKWTQIRPTYTIDILWWSPIRVSTVIEVCWSTCSFRMYIKRFSMLSEVFKKYLWWNGHHTQTFALTLIAHPIQVF